MQVITSVRQMQLKGLKFKQNTLKVGFVPTMGALHKGHISLISKARKENDIVVVSIFVNPSQFGPNEDYMRYPRPFEKDKKICSKEKVDVLFVPCPEEMYPEGHKTNIEVKEMSEMLCGKFRPGHFQGVVTIVAKLFNIVQPDKAYFGQKDFQQLKIIERMVKDLNFSVKIVPCPIIREPEGLAMSSRNQYLSSEDLGKCAVIYQSLQLSSDLVKYHNKNNSKIEILKIVNLIKNNIQKKIPGVKIDYIKVCNPDDLEEIAEIKTPCLIAVAVWSGATRLIDNIIIK